MFLNTHVAFDVESVAAVSTRIHSTILDIDSKHSTGNHIILTSHADVLQITQVYAAGLENVGEFSSYRFGNGEVRRMGRDGKSICIWRYDFFLFCQQMHRCPLLKVGSLPQAVPLQPPKRGQ